MDTVLQGIPGVICYIDDILITGKDEQRHLRSLKEVFQCLRKHGFRMKQEKCEFLMSTIEYFGHQITKNGVQPLPSKVVAIEQAPTPTNIQELCSFLGLQLLREVHPQPIYHPTSFEYTAAGRSEVDLESRVH